MPPCRNSVTSRARIYKNPINAEITRDLINLRETFGDLEALDAWIADPADIDNNEVQVIIKQVYTMFAKAEIFDAKQNVKEFKDIIQIL